MESRHTELVQRLRSGDGSPRGCREDSSGLRLPEDLPDARGAEGHHFPTETVATQEQADEINARWPGKAITVDEAAERRSRYGAVDWYAWRLANWGSKWSASNVEDRGADTLGGSRRQSACAGGRSRPRGRHRTRSTADSRRSTASVYAVDYDEDLHGVFVYGDPETVSRLSDVGVTADEDGYPDPDVWFTTLEEAELADLAAAHGSPCP